jgi:hypothetical protein
MSTNLTVHLFCRSGCRSQRAISVSNQRQSPPSRPDPNGRQS